MTELCVEREEQISRLLSGDLSPAIQDDLEQHLSRCPKCRAYLEEIQEDDRQLTRFADDKATALALLETRVLETADQRRAARPEGMRAIWRLLVQRRVAQLAAAALIVVVAIGSLVLSSPKPVYAQVLKALENARTVHASGHSKRNGQWEKSMEVWYERGLGVVEQETSGRRAWTRIDNGVDQWRHTSGTGLAVKTKSTDPSAKGIVARLFDLGEFHALFSAEPIGTKRVDGIECRIFSRCNSENTWRTDAWLDGDNLVRGWEKSRRDPAGNWEVYQIAAVQYDVPVEKARFVPDFDPDVKVIEGNKLWDRRFDLKNAIYTKEVFGLVFAVHELKRCEGNLVLVVSSMRPTEETIRRFGRADYARGKEARYGDFRLDSSWERLEDGKERAYQPWTLASAFHNGLLVQWDILIPKGSWPKTVKECKLSAYIYAREKIQEELIKEGAQWWQRFRPMVTLALPDKAIPLSDVISAVYRETLQIEPIAPETSLRRATQPDPEKPGRRIGESVKPSQIPQAEYERESRTELQRLGASLEGDPSAEHR